jgi:hypothetical protein
LQMVGRDRRTRGAFVIMITVDLVNLAFLLDDGFCCKDNDEP